MSFRLPSLQLQLPARHGKVRPPFLSEFAGCSKWNGCQAAVIQRGNCDRQWCFLRSLVSGWGTPVYLSPNSPAMVHLSLGVQRNHFLLEEEICVLLVRILLIHCSNGTWSLTFSSSLPDSLKSIYFRNGTCELIQLVMCFLRFILQTDGCQIVYQRSIVSLRKTLQDHRKCWGPSRVSGWRFLASIADTLHWGRHLDPNNQPE